MKRTHSALENIEQRISVIERVPSRVKGALIDAFGEQVTDIELSNEKAEGHDEIFHAFNSTLPEELIERKLNECIAQDKNILDSLDAFLLLIGQRSNTWVIEESEKNSIELTKTVELISSARFDQSLLLGNGNAGSVFSVPDTKNYCAKFLHAPKMQSSTIKGEYALLSTVNDMSTKFEALRVPQSHGIAENIEGTKNFFTMEKVSGMTLEQLVTMPQKRTAEYPTLTTQKIIEILEDKSLKEKLLRDLNTLHNSGIVHNDIHARNIILNSNGVVYLIDFGNSFSTLNLPAEISPDTIESKKELDVLIFSSSIDKAVLALKTELTKE